MSSDTVVARRTGYFSVAAGVAITLIALAVSLATKLTCLAPDQALEIAGHPLASSCYNDIAPLYFWRHMDVGAFPYQGIATDGGFTDFIEYPVLTGLWTWATAGVGRTLATPGDAASGLTWYFAVNVVLLAALWITAILTTARLSSWATWKVALVAAPLLAVHGFTNWDALPIALTMLALLFWSKGTPWATGILIGLGVAAKLYPVFILAALLILCFRAGRLREWFFAAMAAAVTWLVVNLPIVLLYPEGWLEFFRLNSTRPPEYNSWYFIFSTITGLNVPNVNLVSIGMLVFGYLAIGWLALGAERRPRVAQVAFLVVAAFLFTNKVWSPQYSLWLLPLIILACPRWIPIVIWQLSEIAVWILLTPHLGPVDRSGVGYGAVLTAEIVRDLCLAYLVFRVVLESLSVRDDLVRADGIDDPLGGPLERVPDRFIRRGLSLGRV